MSSLYGNLALKRSLGVASLAGVGSLTESKTASVSAPRQRGNVVSTSADDFSPTDLTPSLEEQLYNSAAQAKLLTSRVAMHMDDSWRHGLYRQLDSLLDVEEWLEGEVPLGTNSFATFLRLMLMVRPQVRPGLGLTGRGNLIASWRNDRARLTIECRPNDAIQVLLSHEVDDKLESGVFESTVDRVMEVLRPFNPLQWFVRVAPEPS